MIYESEISIFNKDALKTKFGSIQTNFDVTLGKISAIISDSEIEEYISGHTTMNSKLSSTVQDLEGVHTQVSSMKTDYDSHFTSVESHLTTLDTTVSGISASVSTVSQEAIKTDTIYYLATSASSGVTRSTSGWTTTTQSVTAEKKYLWIYHKYTKGDDSTTYTDPVIAGVYGDTGTSFKWNLVRGTDTLKSGDGLWTSGTWRTTGSAGTVAYNQDIADSPVPNVTKGITITATTANSSIGITQDRCPIRKEQITQSVWVKGSAGDKVRLQPIWSDTSGAAESGSKDITLADGNWTRIEWTKTPAYAHDSVSLCYIVYYAKTAGTTLTVCCPKMEYGSPASEWCLDENEYRTNIGGRNILRDSETMASMWSTNTNATISDGVATLTGISSAWSAELRTSKYDASIYDGDESIISFDYKSTESCLIHRVYAGASVDKDSTLWTRTKYIGVTFTIPSSNGEWKRYVMPVDKISVASLTSGSGDVVSGYLQFYNRTNNAVFQMRHIQFEKGNKPTDWTPAPEDAIAYTDAVEIGGRNLIWGSKNLSLFKKESYVNVERTDSDCTVTNTSGSSSSAYGIYYDVDVTGGAEYALSAMLSNVSGTSQWSIGDVTNGSSKSSWTGVYPYATISNGKFSKILNIPSDCNKIRVYFSTKINDSKFTISNVQLEKGNKATDWTPAPEDVSIEEIATLRYASDSTTTAPSAPTSAVTSTATTTGVWTKATPVLSGTYKYMYMCDQIKWENGLYTWTAVVRDSALEDLVERVTTAELKITDSAIISTVTETVGGKTALNSVIDQRADSIRLKADKISWSSTYSSMTENGTLTASNVELTGKITATSGYIGTAANGFNISSSAIYNGISSVSATSGTGIYLGTDGINLGGGKFKVTTAGAVTAKSLTANDYIYVNGNSSSYLKIPFNSSTNYYLEASSNGLKVRSARSNHYQEVLLSGDTSFGSEIMITSQAATDFLALGYDYVTIGDSLTGVKRATYDLNGISFADSYYQNTQCKVKGTLTVTGTKNRLVETDDYSDRLLYCYETPSPLFGDIGEGEIGEDGKCYVWLDPVFSQTIRTSNYQVSLQSYSPSLTYVMERTGSYFIVGGEPGAKFGWEIKAKQADFAERRLDRFEEQREDDSVNYGLLASNHINELMEGRYAE